MSNHYLQVSKQIGGRNMLSSKCDFFKAEYLKIDFFDDYLILSIPSIDFNGKVSKVTQKSGDWRAISFYCDELNGGRYYFDEDDSDEDEKYLYFEQ